MRASASVPANARSTRATEIGLQHHRMANCCDIRIRCHRDGLLDQRLFHPDAHVAEHQLQQILRFERERARRSSLPPTRLAKPSSARRPSRQTLPPHPCSDRASCLGGLSPDFAKQIKRCGAQISMPPVSRGQRRVARAETVSTALDSRAPPAFSLRAIVLGERLSGKIERKQSGIVQTHRITTNSGQSGGDCRTLLKRLLSAARASANVATPMNAATRISFQRQHCWIFFVS